MPFIDSGRLNGRIIRRPESKKSTVKKRKSRTTSHTDRGVGEGRRGCNSVGKSEVLITLKSMVRIHPTSIYIYRSPHYEIIVVSHFDPSTQSTSLSHLFLMPTRVIGRFLSRECTHPFSCPYFTPMYECAIHTPLSHPIHVYHLYLYEVHPGGTTHANFVAHHYSQSTPHLPPPICGLTYVGDGVGWMMGS